MSDEKYPVDLTARQQDLLAALMQALRPSVVRICAGQDVLWSRLTERITGWANQNNVSPQELDVIYDIMHRTGANE